MAITTITQSKPENYFKKQILCLKFGGISFTGNESIAYKLYSFLLIGSTIFTYGILDGYEVFKHDFETSAGIVIYASIIILTMFKTTLVLIHRIKFGKLLVTIQQEPFLPNPNRGGDEEEKLIRYCNWMVDVQTYIYWISIVVSVISSTVYAISTRLRSDDYHDWELPFGLFTALNVTNSPNYEISLFYQSFTVFMVGVYFSTIDLTIIGVLAHISYQFKLLQNFLEVIMKRSYEEMLKDKGNDLQSSVIELTPSEQDIDASKIPWKYLKKSIKQAVHYHQAIIDAAKEMEEVFQYLLLLAFLITLTCLCFELYHVSSQTTVLGIVRNILEASVCAFQVGTICYWGEQVMLESQEVGRAAAAANYIGSDVRFQKALVLIIRRSQTPTKLTAGKFTDICLTTFTWVMRTSYTVFMVIRNTNAKEI